MLLCPHCLGSVKLLTVLSSVSLIDYFQCEACGKVSERPKDATGQPIPVWGQNLASPPGAVM